MDEYLVKRCDSVGVSWIIVVKGHLNQVKARVMFCQNVSNHGCVNNSYKSGLKHLSLR